MNRHLYLICSLFLIISCKKNIENTSVKSIDSTEKISDKKLQNNSNESGHYDENSEKKITTLENNSNQDIVEYQNDIEEYDDSPVEVKPFDCDDSRLVEAIKQRAYGLDLKNVMTLNRNDALHTCECTGYLLLEEVRYYAQLKDDGRIVFNVKKFSKNKNGWVNFVNGTN